MIGWVTLVIALVVVFAFGFLTAMVVEWMEHARRAAEAERKAACRLKQPPPTIDDINEQHRNERHADLLERWPEQ